MLLSLVKLELVDLILELHGLFFVLTDLILQVLNLCFVASSILLPTLLLKLVLAFHFLCVALKVG